MRDPSFETLTSERLVLRRFVPADAEALAAYRSDPEVARLQGWEAPYSVDEAARFIESLRELAPGTPGTWFQFAVSLAPGDAPIGDCALRTLADEPRQAELGFTFATAHQGRGYASEAVQRVLDYAFGVLAMHRVFSLTDVRNERAARLLERVGFRREGRLVDSSWSKGEWISELLYARTASEWRSDGV